MKRFVLHRKENSNMSSFWVDELICTIRKDGTLTLSNKAIDDEGVHKAPSIQGIKTPERFLEAFYQMNEFLEMDLVKVASVLETHLPEFAQAVLMLSGDGPKDDRNNQTPTMKSANVSILSSHRSNRLHPVTLTSALSQEDKLRAMLHNYRIHKEILMRSTKSSMDTDPRLSASKSILARTNHIIHKTEMALHRLLQEAKNEESE